VAVEVRLVGRNEAHLLGRIAREVFDNPVRPDLTLEFLGDPRHHLAVAIEDGVVVGFASGVHYVHPDKPAELWINEVAVSPSHQQRGLGKAVVGRLLEAARRLGCQSAWVLTDRSNTAARALYASLGGADMEGDIVGVEFEL
jgi:ribosomal protein S18 acetylase RimI-like enzyme